MFLLKGNDFSRVFVIVSARDSSKIKLKISELKKMNLPFIIVCGEKVDHPNIVYRKNRGKWDAINYGATFIPKDSYFIVLNDVDTRIFNFEKAFSFIHSLADLVYCKVVVNGGPQIKFYNILDTFRKAQFHIAASGELMLIKKNVFDRILPIPPCMAEDSFILFKLLELGFNAYFCSKTYVVTERTNNGQEEISYKKRTTLGIYQALSYTKPSPEIRVFYKTLPFFAPLLSFAGKDGKAWITGIEKAYGDYMTKKNPTKF